MLISNSKTPFAEGYILDYDRFPFVLENLCIWNEHFQKALQKGNYDSSDMQGLGYLLSEEGRIYYDNVFDYDSWEYCEEELYNKEKILKGVSSLMQGKIGIDLFLNVYESLKRKEDTFLYGYTEEGLKLAGLTEKEIQRIKKDRKRRRKIQMEPMEKIFKKLEEWRKFPKYQLERRLDLFFAMYLPKILKSKMKMDIEADDIIPEFPLRKEGKEIYASNNADYAVFERVGKKRKLYLIELKTDRKSTQEKKQIQYYEKVQRKNLKEIVEDVIAIYNKSRQWEKYESLLEYMEKTLCLVKKVEGKKRKKKKMDSARRKYGKR